jgi:16S rRNA processing protein RimM
MKNKIPIAKIGKTYGVKGWLKIHLLTDFPEQFKAGKTFESDKLTLTIENINRKNHTIKFTGFNTPEEAKKLTNRTIYSDKKQSYEDIKLKKDEYFWFDIIGSEVYEENKLLGIVKDINRINDIDYIVVKVDKSMQKDGQPKRFLFDFKRHIIEVDTKNKKLLVENTIPILEAS